MLVKFSRAKSSRFKYRIDGKEKLIVFSDCPAVSLSKVRELQDDARKNLSDGLDPSKLKQEEKLRRAEANGQTLEKIGAAFFAKQRKEGKFKATLDKTAYHLKLANRDFGKKPSRR